MIGGSTEEREAELLRLRASERHFRLLAEASPDVIIRYDVAGRITYVSPAARRFGADPDAVVGANVADFLAADDLGRNDAFLAELRAGRMPPQGDANVWRVRTPDGGWAYVEGATTPLVEEGQVVGALAVLRDVTRQKALEASLLAKQQETQEALARLAESEGRYQAVVETVGEAIVWCDVTGRVEFASSAVSLFGYTPEELIGRRDRELIHPDDYIGDVAAAISRGERAPRGPENEFRFLRGDGSWAWVQCSPTPLRDAQGRVRGVMNALRDVTEQRVLKAELDTKRSEAEAAMVAKSQFLANVSHELRTPLTAIVGFAELALRDTSLADSTRISIERVLRGGETLRAVLDNVLDFSKIESAQLELDRTPVEVRELLVACVREIEDAASQKGLDVSTSCSAELPKLLILDERRVRQALGALLANAVKFTEAGSVRIEATYEPEVGQLEFSVADSGIGMDSAAQRRILRPFAQGEASNARRYGGIGLGLAIARGLAELMGGDLAVESAPGVGSRFRLRIPAEPGASDSENATSTPVSVAAAPRILVVDDAPINRELIMELLSPLSAAYVEAGDGGEALAAAEGEPFDLILMDLQMPGMDGIAAARAIRGGEGPNRRTPIVAVSASVQPRDVQDCREAGMDDHIAKPLGVSELTRKVRHWLVQGERSAA